MKIRKQAANLTNKEAAAKGLTAGCYRLTTKSHEVVDAQLSTNVCAKFEACLLIDPGLN